MLIPSTSSIGLQPSASLSRRVNANSQQRLMLRLGADKLIKKGECNSQQVERLLPSGLKLIKKGEC